MSAHIAKIEPLTREAFAPFGDVIEASDAARHFPINAGTTERYHDLADIQLDAQGRAIVSIFRAQPRMLPFAITMLERHPLGSQAFMPLHGRPYLVAVAPRGEIFSASDVRVFLARGDQGTVTANEPGMITREKLSAFLETMPKGDLLMRGDSVAFPAGGCAYLHRHQGPGIRCLIEGGIRIDTNGRSTSFGPGGAWYESGPDAVFAQAATDKPSRFIRVMILPRELHGKSSIQYLNDDDKAKPLWALSQHLYWDKDKKEKPKSQQYKIYADAPISFEARK